MTGKRYRIFKVFENELGSAPVAHLGVWDFYFGLHFLANYSELIKPVPIGERSFTYRSFEEIAKLSAEFADKMVKIRGEKVTAWVEDQDRRVKEEQDAGSEV